MAWGNRGGIGDGAERATHADVVVSSVTLLEELQVGLVRGQAFDAPAGGNGVGVLMERGLDGKGV